MTRSFFFLPFSIPRGFARVILYIGTELFRQRYKTLMGATARISSRTPSSECINEESHFYLLVRCIWHSAVCCPFECYVNSQKLLFIKAIYTHLFLHLRTEKSFNCLMAAIVWLIAIQAYVFYIYRKLWTFPLLTVIYVMVVTETFSPGHAIEKAFITKRSVT